MNPLHLFWRRLGAAALAASLIACGGSLDLPSPPPPPAAPLGSPTLTLAAQDIKTLRLQWAEVAGASEYRVLEDPLGGSNHQWVATVPAGSTRHDLSVFLPAHLNARFVLQACASGVCTASPEITLTPALANGAIGYFKADRLGSGFGQSVALSADGLTLAVGGSRVEGDPADPASPYLGTVTVFTRGATGWTEQARVRGSNTEANDFFGRAVALSADGHTLVVGASGEDSGVVGDPADNSLDNSGAAYVFTRSANTWTQQAYLKAPTPRQGDAVGMAVAVSGDGQTVAVGAPREDGSFTGINPPDTPNELAFGGSGAVYVFARNGAQWDLQAYVKASNTGQGDEFGGALALSADGSTLAVGAYREDSLLTGTGHDGSAGVFDSGPGIPGVNAGAAYVFTRSALTWSQQAYIKASNPDSGDNFGLHLALSGDGQTLAVGAYFEDSDATGIDGAQLNPQGGSFDGGAAYVFTRIAGTWSQQAYVKASNTGARDRFGYRVALSADGQTLAVAAVQEASAALGLGGNASDDSAVDAGAVYLFTRSAGSWSEQRYVKASNTDRTDAFGEGLALSGDGQTLAVGASREDSAATGIGGDQTDNSLDSAGAVYLY